MISKILSWHFYISHPPPLKKNFFLDGLFKISFAVLCPTTPMDPSFLRGIGNTSITRVFPYSLTPKPPSTKLDQRPLLRRGKFGPQLFRAHKACGAAHTSIVHHNPDTLSDKQYHKFSTLSVAIDARAPNDQLFTKKKKKSKKERREKKHTHIV